MATYSSNHNINKKYVQCPYNANHMVPANRMPIHLTKCVKTSNNYLVTCPFNASHRISRDQFDIHLNTCTDRTLVVRKESLPLVMDIAANRLTNRLPVSATRDVKVKADPKPNQTGDDEDWDDD